MVSECFRSFLHLPNKQNTVRKVEAEWAEVPCSDPLKGLICLIWLGSDPISRGSDDAPPGRSFFCNQTSTQDFLYRFDWEAEAQASVLVAFLFVFWKFIKEK